MNILMGIGNVDRGDDGVGDYIARRFKHPGWEVLKCATAPENFTSVIKKKRPARLIVVDAADLRLPPGAFRRLRGDQIRPSGPGTHRLPLYLLLDYMAEFAGEIVFIGVQPRTTEFGDTLSREARDAAKEIAKLIEEDRVGEIPLL
jgi:hydrogenase 3 maturation protease